MVILKVLLIQNLELNKNVLVKISPIITLTFFKPTYSNEFKALPKSN